MDRCVKLGIKIIAMVDTNSNPDDVDYPIPANDDAMRSIKLFASRIADICLEGQEMSRVSQEKENAKKEEAKKAEAKESVKEEPAPDDLPESAPVASDNGNS